MFAPIVLDLRRVLPMVLAGVLALATTGVRAEECPPADPVHAKAKAHREREDKAAQQTIRKLGLSRRQAQRLLPLVEQAAALQVEAFEVEAGLLPDMVEAFSDFALEDSIGEGFHSDVERRTTQINHQLRQEQERITEQLLGLEEEALALLTPAQRNAVEPDDSPGRHPHKEARDRDGKRRSAMEKKLAELRQEIHPHLGKLGRHLFNPAAADVLVETAGVQLPKSILQAQQVRDQGTESYPLAEVDQQQDEVQRLRGEINNWNLINGLHLSADQIGQIVGLYDDVAPKLQAVKGKARRQASLAEVERRVESILNSGQREVLADYKPCLIPPKDLKDPVRIGQANDSSHGEKWLTRARRASQNRRDRLADEALDREAEHYGKLEPAERAKRKQLLLETARQAAAMSDVDFELNKTELAEAIARPDRAEELREEISTLARAEGLPGRVAHFMLNAQFVEQLRDRGRQLEQGVQTRQVNLADGPQAEEID